MSNLYRDDRRATFTYPQTTLLPDSPTSLGPVFLAVLAGAYVVFKASELLGYPVWLWLHQAVQMSLDSIPSLGGLFGDDSDSNDNSQEYDNRGGGMLSNVFGLNSGSLLQKGVRGVTGALSKSYNNAPPGLGNWDNSCYQNSIIQGMASLPSLREYLSSTTTEYNALGDESTNSALLDLINKLNNAKNHGQHFWIRGKLKSMSTFQQQDAQEYYSKIMDALDKEIKDATNNKRRSTASWLLAAKSLSNSHQKEEDQQESEDEHQNKELQDPVDQPKPIPNPLDGLLAQRVGCITCGYSEGLALIPFNCITVPLGRNYTYDVRECLDEYTSLELIQGVECAKCTVLKTHNTLSKLVKGPDSPFASRLEAVKEALDEEDFDDKTLIKKCGVAKKNWVQSTKSRQAVIARAPKSLVLHVNRSIFDEMTGAQYKNTAAVLYPKVLDLGTWCLGSRPSQSQSVDESVEEWPRDPTKSMLGDANSEPTADSPFQYTLKAAVTHFGSHGNGHYTCYRNQAFSVHKPTSTDSGDSKDSKDWEEKPAGEQWWRTSDESVYSISEEAALQQKGVFMLFYERIDADSDPSPPSSPGPVKINQNLTSQDMPLPPQKIQALGQQAMLLGHMAANVPLPKDGDDDEEDIFPLSLSESPALRPFVADPLLDVDGCKVHEPIPDLVDVSSAFVKPTPPSNPLPTVQQDDTEMSEEDSDDAPSTELTSDDDPDDGLDEQIQLKDFSIIQMQQNSPSSPQWMRTAGSTTGRGEGSRASLPMVTAS